MQDFDRDVASRQAFGAHFEEVPQDRELVDLLLGGTLQMPPHGPWQFPPSLAWNEDPFSQRNWTAQLHMLRWLDPARRAALKGDEAARDLWLRHVRSWIQKNPPGAGRSPYAWADMVDGLRALELTLGLPLVPDEDLPLVLASLEQHGAWMADERHLGHSNHALHQHQGLLVVGLVLGREDWRDMAVRRLGELIVSSYDEQGTNAEGAIGYHLSNLRWWSHAMRRLEIEGLALPPEAERLSLAAKGLAHATRPDGLLEMIGDTGRARPVGYESPYLDYVRSSGSAGLPPGENTLVLDRGYVFSRSGWGEFERDFDKEVFWSASFGRANRVHGHADGGSLTFFADRPWLVDSGKYAYVNDDMSAFVRSRNAHNVVVIRDRPYDPKSVVELTRARLSEDLDDVTFVDKGYAGVTLTRRVVYCRGGDFLLVMDVVDADDEILADQLWHVEADTKVARDRNHVTLTARGQRASMVWAGNSPTFSTVKGSLDPFQGWTSRKWLEKVPSEVVIATRKGRKFRFLTLIAKPRSGAFSLDFLTSGASGLLASVTSGSLSFHLQIEPNDSSVHVGERPAHFTHAQSLRPKKPVDRLAESLRDRPSDAVIGLDDVQIASDRDVARVAREKVRIAGGGVSVRSAIGALLLDRLRRTDHRRTADAGLRAAIVDIVGADLMAKAGVAPQDLGWQRNPLVRWEAQRPIVHPRYRQPVIPSHDVLAAPSAAFEAPRIGVHETHGLVMPYTVRGGSTDVLIVRFHGAITRARTELPLFQGLSSSLKSEHAFLVFQDPTLDLDPAMNLAWYLGRAEVDLFAEIATIIRTTSEKVGASRVVLIGPSGGGYAALQVAANIEGSHAIAFSPQIVLDNYFRTAVTKAIDASFGVPVVDDLPPQFGERVSVISRWSRETADFTATIVQNTGDAHHNTQHIGLLRQWLADRPDLSPRVEFPQLDLGPGHVSVPLETQTRILDQALARLATDRLR